MAIGDETVIAPSIGYGFARIQTKEHGFGVHCCRGVAHGKISRRLNESPEFA